MEIKHVVLLACALGLAAPAAAQNYDRYPGQSITVRTPDGTFVIRSSNALFNHLTDRPYGFRPGYTYVYATDCASAPCLVYEYGPMSRQPTDHFNAPPLRFDAPDGEEQTAPNELNGAPDVQDEKPSPDDSSAAPDDNSGKDPDAAANDEAAAAEDAVEIEVTGASAIDPIEQMASASLAQTSIAAPVIERPVTRPAATRAPARPTARTQASNTRTTNAHPPTANTRSAPAPAAQPAPAIVTRPVPRGPDNTGLLGGPN